MLNSRLFSKGAPVGVGCSQIPQDGLVASYLLQGTAEDETGTHNGTETSMAYAYDDERGVVGDFATGRFLTLSNSTVFTSGASISVWARGSSIKYSGTVGSNDIIKLYNGTYYTFYTYNSIIGASARGTSVSPTVTYSTATLNDTDWYMITTTVGLSGQLKLYINGIEVASIASAPNWKNQGSTNDIGGATGSWVGNLSNVHIYNKELTAQEVTDIYNIEKYQHNNALDEGLIAYYPLDGNSLDNAINQYDGTDTNVTYPTDAGMGVVSYFNGSASITSTASAKTVAMWVKCGAVTAYIFDTRLSGGTGWFLVSSGVLNFSGVKCWVDGIEVSPSTENIGDNQWHLVVLEMTSTETSFILGAKYDYTVDYVGYLSKARCYNRALSAKEIDWLYDYEKPASTECLYNSTIDNPDPFEDGSGIALFKLDGNANDITGDHNGTPTSVTYTDGEFGQCANFEAATSTITGTASISSVSMICERLSSSSQSADRGRMFTSDIGGTKTDVMWLGAGLAVRQDNATNFRINGVATDIAPAFDTKFVLEFDLIVPAVNKAFTIGGYDASAQTYQFGGNIEQVRFYNRGLTASDSLILQNERKV